MIKAVRASSPAHRHGLWLVLALLLGCGASTPIEDDDDSNGEEDSGDGDSGDGDSGDGDSGDGDSGDGDSGDGDSGDGDSGDGDSGDGDSGDGDTPGDGDTGDGDTGDGDTGDGDTPGDGDTGDGDTGDGDTGDGDDPDPPIDPGITIIDHMEPSYLPPGGLQPEDVPLFVVLGFDDNRYADGMTWVLDELAKRKNPAGSGNARTHDGDPVIVSFYYTTNALDEGGDELLNTWKRATAAGHEVANHTHTHRALENQGTAWDWVSEIETSNDILADVLSVPKESIIGVRAPFLQFDKPLFDTIGSQGMMYYCSITHYPVGKDGEEWQFFRHVWPYTLHNDVADRAGANQLVGKHEGLWEIPVYSIPRYAERARAEQQAITGFDSSALVSGGQNAQQFLTSLKWALDQRLESGDSRAPLTIGLHSDTFSVEFDQADPQKPPYPSTKGASERQDILLEFIDYALTKPDVRFVSTKQLLQWMSDPKPL